MFRRPSHIYMDEECTEEEKDVSVSSGAPPCVWTHWSYASDGATQSVRSRISFRCLGSSVCKYLISRMHNTDSFWQSVQLCRPSDPTPKRSSSYPKSGPLNNNQGWFSGFLYIRWWSLVHMGIWICCHNWLEDVCFCLVTLNYFLDMQGLTLFIFAFFLLFFWVDELKVA